MIDRPAPSLNERVAFESPSTTPDGFGGQENTWTTEFTVRAYYKRLRGSERVISARLEGVQPTVVKVRASSDTRRATNDWRIRDTRTGEIMNIRSYIESDNRQYIDFTAESGVAT